ncbi:cyclase family protein [Microbacterium sp. SSM24]|uniref:cyclase family protein n=1 Tax=Microbacterium sp. SSM24 TaxID=2991714 RepID=UPI0022271237|nr:cyclase family protein [Microbacterium sp. SSM24]MCW3492661.1 cyclase family protein [Microbacterium sp. SSM24]
MPSDQFPSYRELGDRSGALRGTAWGLFGEGDQVGTLNFLTSERVRAALGSVRKGLLLNLNLPLDAFDPPLIAHRGAIEHHVFGLNEFHRDERIDNLFTQASTQIDGLRHFAHPDHGFYNGVPGDRLIAGTGDLGIQAVAQRGIVGRGVLADVARYRDAAGRPIEQDSPEPIPVSDLTATLREQGTTLLHGDILLIRTGWLEHIRRAGATRADPLASPGLAAQEETAAWLWDNQIALVAADNIALEPWPATESALTTIAEQTGRLARSSHTGMLHRILIPLLGLSIGELWDLDALATECAGSGHYDFLVTAEPLNLTGGVGSPANALAIV